MNIRVIDEIDIIDVDDIPIVLQSLLISLIILFWIIFML